MYLLEYFEWICFLKIFSLELKEILKKYFKKITTENMLDFLKIQLVLYYILNNLHENHVFSISWKKLFKLFFLAIFDFFKISSLRPLETLINIFINFRNALC